MQQILSTRGGGKEVMYLPLSAAGKAEFGRWLAGRRDEVGLGTQQEAADRIGISRVQLARWESGSSLPSWGIVPAIADAIRVEVNEVYRRAGFSSPDVPDLSEWAASLARRIERRTAGIPTGRRSAIERAVDSILAVSDTAV